MTPYTPYTYQRSHRHESKMTIHHLISQCAVTNVLILSECGLILAGNIRIANVLNSHHQRWRIGQMAERVVCIISDDQHHSSISVCAYRSDFIASVLPI